MRRGVTVDFTIYFFFFDKIFKLYFFLVLTLDIKIFRPECFSKQRGRSVWVAEVGLQQLDARHVTQARDPRPSPPPRHRDAQWSSRGPLPLITVRHVSRDSPLVDIDRRNSQWKIFWIMLTDFFKNGENNSRFKDSIVSYSRFEKPWFLRLTNTSISTGCIRGKKSGGDVDLPAIVALYLPLWRERSKVPDFVWTKFNCLRTSILYMTWWCKFAPMDG